MNMILFLATIFVAINCSSALSLNATLNATSSNATSSNATSSNATDLREIVSVKHFNVTEYHKIQIKENILPHGVKNKTYRLRTNLKSEHEIPSSLIFETDETFYFVTRVDHKANLTINFNYRVSPKKLLVARYEYEVQEHGRANETFDSELEVEFKNLNFKTYLEKEAKILGFFNSQGNDAVVSGIIENNNKNLRVILANPSVFSLTTRRLADPRICKDLDKIAGLDIVPCSIVTRKLDKVKNNYEKNEVNLDFDLVMMSSSLQISFNHLLMAALICIQARFLF